MALNDDEEAALRAEMAALRTEFSNTKSALTAANKESQGHRLNADRANDAANAAKAALDEAKAEAARHAEALRTELTGKATEAETRAAEAKVTADQRVINAEVRAAAVLAGMKKPDLVKLLDLSAVKLGDDGKVLIPEKLFEDAKASDPYLFGTALPSTSSGATPPDPAGNKAPALFKDMTPEQQTAWKRSQGIR